MLLLAGLMAMLAVGATVLVALETLSKRGEESEQDAETEAGDVPEEAQAEPLDDGPVTAATIPPFTETETLAMPDLPDPTDPSAMPGLEDLQDWLADDFDTKDTEAPDTSDEKMGAAADLAPEGPVQAAGTSVAEAEPDDVTPAEGSDALRDWQAQEAEAQQPWLAQAHQAQVSDFSAQEDRLVIVYDDQAGPAPLVGLEPDDEEAGRLHVTLDGIRVSAVDRAEGLTLDHILLVAESAIPNAAAA